MNRVVYCMFSGGRDSAVACAIAKRVADVKGWGFRLIHIDTGVQLPGVREYVKQYADWLRAELVVLHAKVDYWGASKSGGIRCFGITGGVSSGLSRGHSTSMLGKTLGLAIL